MSEGWCGDHAMPGPSGAEPASAPAGYRVTPPALPRPVIFDQRWTADLHPLAGALPESVASSLPAGLAPTSSPMDDTWVWSHFAWQHQTRHCRSYVGTFRNQCRLYSIDNAGRHGVLSGRPETLD